MRDWLFLLLGLVLSETAEFAPEVMKRLIKKAVKGLPEEDRDVLEEAWLAELDACMGKWSKFIYIFSLIQNRREVIHAIEEARGNPSAVIRAQKFTRAFDLIYIWLLLPAVLPIMALICLLIYLEDQGHPFYLAERTGLGGKSFGQFMFRTMKKDSEEILRNALRDDPALWQEWRQTGRLRRDPRLTRVGQILHKSGLRRLPLFINVLLGDMSIIGPMALPRHWHKNSPQLAQLYRHARPGLISGAWHEEFNQDSFSWTEWVLAEQKYQETWSPLGHFSALTLRFQVKYLPPVKRLPESKDE